MSLSVKKVYPSSIIYRNLFFPQLLSIAAVDVSFIKVIFMTDEYHKTFSIQNIFVIPAFRNISPTHSLSARIASHFRMVAHLFVEQLLKANGRKEMELRLLILLFQKRCNIPTSGWLLRCLQTRRNIQ